MLALFLGTAALPHILEPRVVFEQLFGAGNSASGTSPELDDAIRVLQDDLSGDVPPEWAHSSVPLFLSEESIAEIALLAAKAARPLGLEPRVAMLSFSNFGSVPHPLAAKVRRATEVVRARRPDLAVDGEMQADVAVTPELIEEVSKRLGITPRADQSLR